MARMNKGLMFYTTESALLLQSSSSSSWRPWRLGGSIKKSLNYSRVC